jgi:hypothetical protein
MPAVGTNRNPARSHRAGAGDPALDSSHRVDVRHDVRWCRDKRTGDAADAASELLRMPAVLRCTGLGRSTIYRLMVSQRALSPQTVACYRDSLKPLLDFASRKLCTAPTARCGSPTESPI